MNQENAQTIQPEAPGWIHTFMLLTSNHLSGTTEINTYFTS